MLASVRKPPKSAPLVLFEQVLKASSEKGSQLLSFLLRLIFKLCSHPSGYPDCDDFKEAKPVAWQEDEHGQVSAHIVDVTGVPE